MYNPHTHFERDGPALLTVWFVVAIGYTVLAWTKLKDYLSRAR